MVGQWHVGSTADDAVISQVKAVLDADPTSTSVFNDQWFQPPPPDWPLTRGTPAFPSRDAEVSIDSPTQGTSVSPGDEIVVTVSSTGDVSSIAFLRGRQGNRSCC